MRLGLKDGHKGRRRMAIKVGKEWLESIGQEMYLPRSVRLTGIVQLGSQLFSIYREVDHV
jgi:hypothetical protein